MTVNHAKDIQKFWNGTYIKEEGEPIPYAMVGECTTRLSNTVWAQVDVVYQHILNELWVSRVSE